jgi:hypothetical protein
MRVCVWGVSGEDMQTRCICTYTERRRLLSAAVVGWGAGMLVADAHGIGVVCVAQVYLIDFGLSKRYVEPRTNQHIPYRTGKSLTGLRRRMASR